MLRPRVVAPISDPMLQIAFCLMSADTADTKDFSISPFPSVRRMLLAIERPAQCSWVPVSTTFGLVSGLRRRWLRLIYWNYVASF